MKFQDNPKLEECLKIATEAKALRDKAKEQYNELLKQAEPIEARAVEAFRNLREEVLKTPREERERLIEEKKAIESEYFELASTFCKQNGTHTPHYRWIPSIVVKEHGNLYPTCIICGSVCNATWIFEKHKRYYYRPGSEEVIQEAAMQTSNLNLQKTAQRIKTYSLNFSIPVPPSNIIEGGNFL